MTVLPVSVTNPQSPEAPPPVFAVIALVLYNAMSFMVLDFAHFVTVVRRRRRSKGERCELRFEWESRVGERVRG